MKLSRMSHAIPILICLVLAIGLSLPVRRAHDRVEIRSVRMEDLGSRPVRLRVYVPAGEKGRLPAVVVCPPLGVSAGIHHSLAMQIARAGMVCAVIDFFGERPEESRQRLTTDAVATASKDVENAVAFLRYLPEADPSRVGLVGYSFGGAVVLEDALRDKAICATVLIGMNGDATPARPRNLLFIAGLYDELHPQSELLRSLASAAGVKAPSPNTRYGSFEDGSGRQLTIVPTASHLSEIIHPTLIADVTGWLSEALDRPACKEKLSYSLSACTQWGALFSLLVLTGLFLRTFRQNETVFRTLVAVVSIAAYAWSVSGIWPDLPRIGLAFCALPCMVAGWSGVRAGRPGILRALLLNGAALYAAYCITMVGGNLLNYVKEPIFLLSIPLFPFVNAFLVAVYVFQRLAMLWEGHPGPGCVQAAGALLCIAEMVRPGFLLSIPDRIVRHRAPARARAGRWKTVVLVVLIAILAFAVQRRFQEGMLNAASLWAVGGVLLRLAVPMLVLFVMIRSLLRRFHQ